MDVQKWAVWSHGHLNQIGLFSERSHSFTNRPVLYVTGHNDNLNLKLISVGSFDLIHYRPFSVIVNDDFRGTVNFLEKP